MVLPNSQTFHPVTGSQFSPPKRKVKYRSYAQATKVPLMHQHIVPPHFDDSSKLNILQTSFFRTSRTKGAFLFDISSCKEKYTDQQCMIILKEQHPSVHACVPLNDGPRRYLEVYITPQNDNNDILNQGLIFKEANLRIYPRASLDDNAKTVNLKLNHLPLLPKKDILSGLQRSLAVFGEIMDVGITTEAATGFFMGSGYAVLNVQQAADTTEIKKFQELSHQISWCETSNFFHATWNNMPTWCRYCHKEGHTKFECPASKARIICYSCHQHGHRSFECPRRNNNLIINKTRRTYQNKPIASIDVVNQTTKLQDSDDDSDDSDYHDEEMEDVSESSDKEEEQTIDQDEILQLKQDLQLPVHTSTNVLQMNQTIGQDEGLITSPKQNTQATAMDSTMNDIHGQHGELSAFRTGTHSEVHTGTSNSHIYHL